MRRSGYHPFRYANGEQSESGLAWWLFDGSLDDAAIYRALDDPRGYHGGPGRAFGDRVLIRRVGRRALVTQHVGLDV